MKFENDYFKVQIEKKELTTEQKEASKIRWKKRRPAVIVAALLIVAILGGVVYNSVMAPKDSAQTDAGVQTAANNDGNNSGNNTNEQRCTCRGQR